MTKQTHIARGSLGIYIHVPFCKKKCKYCDFYSVAGADSAKMDAYADALVRHIGEYALSMAGYTVDTVYFGGGTPSLCTPEAIRGLLDHAAQLFDCSGAEETTLEANPDDLTPAYLAALRRAGVNRLSVGIQSFDDACLKLMNRRHNAAQAVEAVRSAQREGLSLIHI